MTQSTDLNIKRSSGKDSTSAASMLAQSLEMAFPDVDPNETPLGSKVLLQIKQPATKTRAGLVLSSYDIETEFDNTQVAKVLAVGAVAFRNRSTLEPWPEGAWFTVGQYVRVSQHDGRRWTRPIPGTKGVGVEERVTFVLMEELHVNSVVHDPLAAKGFF